MSFFFDYNLALKKEEAITTAWSHSEFQPILAVSTNAPRIIFVQEEATMVPDFEIKRGKIASVLSWHPLFPSLAIGWQDGVITLWNEDQRLTREEKVLHKSEITNITFSADGTRMVTGDEQGTVGVWRTHRGLTPICQYSKSGAITNVAFCGLAFEEDSMEKWNSLFFFGGKKGSVCLADDLKNCSEVCKVGGSVKSLLFYEKENSVIIITSHLLLVQFKINLNEKLVPDRKVKLSVAGDPEKLITIWAGTSLLVTASGENMLRLLHLDEDETYLLTLSEDAFAGKLMRDKIVTISYNQKKRILAAGTKDGNIVMWKCKSMSAKSPSSAEGWEAKPPFKSKINAKNPSITHLSWGGASNILSGMNDNGVMILSQTVLKKRMKGDLKIMQCSNKAVEVRMKNPANPNADFQIIMTLAINIKGLDCYDNFTLFWDGKYAQIYEVFGDKNPALIGTFESNSKIMAIYEDSVFQSKENKIEVLNYQGEVKQMVPLTEQDGEIIHIDVIKKHMAVITANNMIRIYDISRRNIKQIGMTRKFGDGSPCEIKSIALNADGKKLAILADQLPIPSIRIPDIKFYIYDVEMDTFMDSECEPDRVPAEAFWDQQDSRLLCLETEYMKMGEENQDEEFEGDEEMEDEKKDEAFTGKTIEKYFVTGDYGIKKQDSINFDEGEETLLGSNVPYLFFLGHKKRKKEDDEEEEDKDEEVNKAGSFVILRKTMKDFAGLESVEEDTKKAILNFSFYLTCGNLDDAYNSVRTIQNISVWQVMAQMCVKNKRLDVAQVCLGNMRFARGARAAREAEDEKEIEARLGLLSIQLNMIDEAKDLFIQCGRYDLLCNMLTASGEWDEAIEIAEKSNRINLKNIYYQMAQHYEQSRDFELAIDNYVKSNTHAREVPRMLYKNGMFSRLEQFIEERQEPELYKWWAQYNESKNNIEEALNYYQRAEDHASLVRLFILNKDLNSAMQTALETQDPAACFYLARSLEEMGNLKEAIQYYSKAQRYHHAVRLAQEHNFDNDVFQIAKNSNAKKVMLQCAEYFERRNRLEQAVVLFDKGGNGKRAMNIAIKNNMPDLMQNLSINDTENITDPDDIEKSAQFFEEHHQYDKAVELKINAGHYEEALELAEKYNVDIPDKLADKLIPERSKDTMKEQIRMGLLMRVGKHVQKRGNFQLACKMFTQAKQKVKAMQCLLHSGDTQKIIQYAQTARNAEVYVLAANFLQNSDWHNDPTLMKTIITFYSKAKAYEQLSGFYDACAQVEIDEYRDYAKALGAMREALKQLNKSDCVNKEDKIEMLQKRINIIEEFVEARNLTKSDPDAMERLCVQLLDYPEVEAAIRIGDVYAQLIENSYEKGDMQSAYSYLQGMKKRKIILTPYLDQEMIDNIYSANGVPNPAHEVDDDDDIKEDF